MREEKSRERREERVPLFLSHQRQRDRDLSLKLYEACANKGIKKERNRTAADISSVIKGVASNGTKG